MVPTIPFEKCQEGIMKSINNAQRYFGDALFLYKHGNFESSILLSMLSYEESGKTIMLVNYAKNEQAISKTIWRKEFCSHIKKNLACLKLIWQEVNISERFEGQRASTSKFQQDWKNVFTYVDYDFENGKWTSPLNPETFRGGKASHFVFRLYQMPHVLLK